MHRLFVALPIPSMLSARLIAAMAGVAGARWQSAEQLHLTLAYIGEVDGDAAERIDAALRLVSHPPVDLAVAGVGHFEKKGLVHSLWACGEPADQLGILAAKVRRAIARAGVPIEERAFVPHITMARLNSASGPVEGFLAANATLTCPPERVDHFVLYESILGSRGAVYRPLETYALT
jgi:RNA 2',3'-cyclic 3'-phosphodiesterase